MQVPERRSIRSRRRSRIVGPKSLPRTPAPAAVENGYLNHRLLGAGKAIISTPYWHAAEVLDHGRGLLVPFESPAAIAKATIKLLDDDKARQAMRERAYLYARPMVWKRVAQSYMATILRARVRPAEPVQIGFAIQTNTREADQRAVSA
jgi:hypothetical protein